MSAASDDLKRPCEPITFTGVAGFAVAPLSRLVVVELIVAVAAAICVMWFAASVWMPVITMAVSRLPDESLIRSGKLEWPPGAPGALAESPFLSLHAAPQSGGEAGQEADLRLEFRATALRLQSILGYVDLRYPQGWTILLNRAKLEPWWGAWRPMIVAGMGLATCFGLLVTWAILALLCAFAVRLMASCSNRQVTRFGCWKLASAALMPGAVLLSGAIILYGLHRLSLVGFLFAFALHLIVGWVYVVGAPLRLPRVSSVEPPSVDPFASASEVENPFKEDERPPD